MGRGHMVPVVGFVLVLAFLTRASWMGCVGLPYTLDVWLHQTRHLRCDDMTLFYERPDKVVANCAGRRDASMVRTGEPFEVCGRRFDAEIERSYPEERYRLTVTVPP